MLVMLFFLLSTEWSGQVIGWYSSNVYTCKHIKIVNVFAGYEQP